MNEDTSRWFRLDSASEEGKFELSAVESNVKGLRIGLDLGSRSVGWAIVGCDKSWLPVQELGRGVVRHDGGVGDPESEASRKSLRAAARRQRTRYGNQRKRRKALKAALRKALGEDTASGPPASFAGLADKPNAVPWIARLALAAPIEHGAAARFLLPIALLHIQKHPGQRNPFHSLRRILAEVENGLDGRTSAAFDKFSQQLLDAASDFAPSAKATIRDAIESGTGDSVVLDALSDLVSVRDDDRQIRTLGEHGALSYFHSLLSGGAPAAIRNTSSEEKEPRKRYLSDEQEIAVAANRIANGLLPSSPRAQDQIAEILTIWRIQSPHHPDLFTQELLDEVLEVIFTRERPRVRAELVAECTLNGRKDNGEVEKRTPRWNPLAHEFRVHQDTMNLQVQEGRTRRPLNRHESDSVLDLLLGATSTVSFKEIEDRLGLKPDESLIHRDRLGTSGGVTPSELSRLPAIASQADVSAEWKDWLAAADQEKKREFLIRLADASYDDDAGRQEPMLDEIAEEFLGVPASPLDAQRRREDLLQILDVLPRGRSQFGPSALKELTAETRAALRRDSNRPSIDDLKKAVRERMRWTEVEEGRHKVRNPTVAITSQIADRIIRKLVRHYMKNHRNGGSWDVQVQVEMARSAYLRRENLEREIRFIKVRRERREEVRAALKLAKGKMPTREEVERHVQYGLQKGKCAYCGRSIDPESRESVEWDHVVPRAGGGGNRRGNLVLACRECNSEKNDRTVVKWLETEPRRLAQIRIRILGEDDRAITPEARALAQVDQEGVVPWDWESIPDRELRELEKDRYRERLFTARREPQLGLRHIAATAWAAREVLNRAPESVADAGGRLDHASPVPSDAVREVRDLTHHYLKEEKSNSERSTDTRKFRIDHANHADDALAAALITPDHLQSLLCVSRVRRDMKDPANDEFRRKDADPWDIAEQLAAQGYFSPISTFHIRSLRDDWLRAAAPLFSLRKSGAIVPRRYSRSWVTGALHSETIRPLVHFTEVRPPAGYDEPDTSLNGIPAWMVWHVGDPALRPRLVRRVAKEIFHAELDMASVVEPDLIHTRDARLADEYSAFLDRALGEKAKAFLPGRTGILVRGGWADTGTNAAVMFAPHREKGWAEALQLVVSVSDLARASTLRPEDYRWSPEDCGFSNLHPEMKLKALRGEFDMRPSRMRLLAKEDLVRFPEPKSLYLDTKYLWGVRAPKEGDPLAEIVTHFFEVRGISVSKPGDMKSKARLYLAPAKYHLDAAAEFGRSTSGEIERRPFASAEAGRTDRLQGVSLEISIAPLLKSGADFPCRVDLLGRRW